MPDYAVRICRTIVETVEWVFPAADETVARRHAEEYLPLIQDDPEFLSGYQKYRNKYDWVIVRVEEKKGEEAGCAEEMKVTRYPPQSAHEHTKATRGIGGAGRLSDATPRTPHFGTASPA